MKRIVGLLVLTIMNSVCIQAQGFRELDSEGLHFDVFNADESSFGIASVLVSGKDNAILFDTQFTRSNAEKVAQYILKSGKELQSVFITHGDPDFYFGLEVLKKYFPNVIAYTTPENYKHIQETAQNKLDFWGANLGDAIPKNIVLPQIFAKDKLDLEGYSIQIIGLEKFPDRTFIWIPKAKTVLGGINVFGDTFHVWTADAAMHEDKESWIRVLKEIELLKPKVVIPAHGNSESSLDIKSVTYTIGYLQDYIKAVDVAKNSNELINLMREKYPKARFDAALKLGAPVNKGEVKW